MKLAKVHVTNYRSVEDSGEFSVENLTCLVGKNEAGKTAILQAIAGLNPHPSTPIVFDQETDYPRRHLIRYTQRHPNEQAKVISTKWMIEPHEKAEIEAALGPSALTSEFVTIFRRYGDDKPQVSLSVDIETSLQYVIEQEGLVAAEKKALGVFKDTQTLKNNLEAIAERSGRQEALLQRLSKLGSVTGFATAIVTRTLPQFMYFSHYDRMAGQLRIDDVKAREANGQKLDTPERVFLDFLEFAGTSVEEITQSQTYEALNAKCEAASLDVTSQLKEYWTQNPFLEIDVRVTKAEPKDAAPFNAGVIARARVKNTLHGVTVPFSERSAGFIWFFSFLVKFAQVQKDGTPLVLMLDEPGLTLHGKAQADLLRYFAAKLEPEYQVIFSTHSPFMVPHERMSASRIVEDRVVQLRPGVPSTEGTKVREDYLAVDPDTLFPLQGALGYDITQTLFVGKNTLLVEGPGDVLLLQILSNELKRRRRAHLDTRWTMCPAGGIDKIQSFVALFAGNQLSIGALTDYGVGDKRKIENLRNLQTLGADRVITFAEVLQRDEADVEDVFDASLYCRIVSAALELKAKESLTMEKLSAAAPNVTRLVKQMEAACRLLPPETMEFDHFLPAAWLAQNSQILSAKDDATVTETLDRAEAVFAKVNALLK